MNCCDKPGLSRRTLTSGCVKEHCRNCGQWVIHTTVDEEASIPPVSLARRVQAYLQIRRTLGR